MNGTLHLLDAAIIVRYPSKKESVLHCVWRDFWSLAVSGEATMTFLLFYCRQMALRLHPAIGAGLRAGKS